jgi:hypothetical protein
MQRYSHILSVFHIFNIFHTRDFTNFLLNEMTPCSQFGLPRGPRFIGGAGVKFPPYRDCCLNSDIDS